MKIKYLKIKMFVSAAIAFYALVLYMTKAQCLFYSLTGIPCLTCGMTRALISAVRLDFSAAFSYNFMFPAVPVLYICFLRDGRLFLNKTANACFYATVAIGFILNVVLKL